MPDAADAADALAAAAQPAPPHEHPLPLRTLAYRYLFFGWLFRDAGVRNLFERAAALAHNRSAARWLPTYLRRWTVIGVGGWVIGSVVEALLGAPLLSLLFFVPAALAGPVNAVILAAWIGLRGPMG